MGLIDEMRTESKPRHQGCVIASIFTHLKGEDFDDLHTALSDATITNVAITKVLRQRGHNCDKSGKQVARHRRGECQCDD